MTLHPIDLAIIGAYLVLTMGIGVLQTKKASKNLDSYFLGGKTLPWYILGVSNASGMFDITGTMWFVAAAATYGMKSAWSWWVWPMFNQIFLMVYLAAWLRRSDVLTGAEWIKTRFGTGRGARMAHVVVVVYSLVGVVGFLAYAFQGIGKFSAEFLPWNLSPEIYAALVMGLTTIYVVAGGLHSVVLTEVLQFLVMTVVSFIVAGIAMARVSPEALDAVVPEGWRDITFGWTLDLDWTGLIDALNTKIVDDGWSYFTIFFMIILFKGFLVSAAGPAPNFDMQRVLATRSPREASLMSFLVNVVLFPARVSMIAAITVLGLVYYSGDLRAMGDTIDFELMLPWVIRNFIPVGVMGLLLAGLLAAFMSTFAAQVNAAPAYLVNDIYRRFINPKASNRRLIVLSYLASIGVVLLGMGFGMVVQSIHQVTMWIVAALWGGYIAANILKWHWWRFNGYGYFWGMATGIAAALATPRLLPELSALHSFPIILAVSTVGSVVGSLLTPPDEEEVLKSFYRTVRPWGFWKPVHDLVAKDDPEFRTDADFKRDASNIAVGLVWQAALIALPMYVVFKMGREALLTVGVVVVTSVLLKKRWYDRLAD